MAVMKILGASQLSACGVGLGALREALDGRQPEPRWIPVGPRDAGPEVPVLRAVNDGLYDLVSPRAVRRLDDFSRNFIYAAQMAVDESGLELPPPERIGVVTGTGYASLNTSFSLLDDLIGEGDEAGSPFKFTTAVNNSSATSVATYLDARGPCLSVLGFSDVVLNVLRVAQQWLDEDRVDLVVAGAGDEYHPVVGYGLMHLGGWAADGVLRPFAFDRSTRVPGETFAVFLVGRADDAASALAEIQLATGYGTLVEQYRPLPEEVIFLAADGGRATALIGRSLLQCGHPAAAYSSLWGANPSAEAMTLLAAVLSVKRGSSFGLPAAARTATEVTILAPDTPLEGRSVACIALSSDGSGSLVRVGRPDR